MPTRMRLSLGLSMAVPPMAAMAATAAMAPIAAIAVAVVIAVPAVADAQRPAPRSLTPALPPGLAVPPAPFAGSEDEDALRIRQLLGEVPLHPWSVRPFGPQEMRRLLPPDSATPGGPPPAAGQPRGRTGTLAAALLPAELRAWYNSAFPYGFNDGVVWAGRGLTTAAQAGAVLRAGPLTATLYPVATWSQNAAFELQDNRQEGPRQYADALNPIDIDRPQRFGPSAVSRVDPGQSTVRVDLAGLTAGVSTANLWWGPMLDQPFIIGNNAGGFPHLFLGSSRPWNVWLGHVHGRVVYTELQHTEWFVIPDSLARRFGAGAVGVFVPRGLPNLELGVARFFHVPWPGDGLGPDEFLKPLEGFLKDRLPDLRESGDTKSAPDNQLASAFARLTIPRAGLELYGEFGRDDHNQNFRDLLVQPDHLSTLGLGARRAWRSGEGRVRTLRLETTSFRVTHIENVRGQAAIYTHGSMRQGHTHDGQVLGAPMGGRSAHYATAELQQFDDGGMWRGSLSRYMDERTPNRPTQEQAARWAAHAERTFLRGPLEWRAGLTLVRSLNHHYTGSDETNVRLLTGARWIF